MDETRTDVRSMPATGTPVEGRMLGEDVVREVLARLARGEHFKTIARELGVDKKTIKRWRRRGAWQPRAPRVYVKAIDAHREFLTRRGPEVDRFARETLTPLGSQPPYHYTAPRRRIVAADALVAIAAGRYSVPVRNVGQTVDVRETATHYVIVAGDTCIARHAKAGRHAVVMEPAHYAGLLRPGAAPLADAPQWDPAYPALGAVEVRDLAVYEALSAMGGGR